MAVANQEYLIKGVLTMSRTAMAAGRRFEDLRAVAYKFINVVDIDVFGACSVDASGEFELAFEYGLVGSSPLDISIMPIPEVIESGLRHVERSIPGLYFPKVHIAAGDWVLTRGVYTWEVEIAIPDHIWVRWDWLSEEFTVIGQVKKQVGQTLLPVAFARVVAEDVDLPSHRPAVAADVETDEWGTFTITFRRIDFFVDLAAYSGTARRYGTESWPDLIFTVLQNIGRIPTFIHEETQSDARPRSMWDEPYRTLKVTLITDKGITFDEEYPRIPAGDNFLFHGIGVVDPHAFTDGYATTGPGDDLPNLQDCPFGGTLHIKGHFDTTSPIPPPRPQYYQVLYAKWEGSTAPDDSEFEPIQHESWTVSKCDLTTYNWEPLVIEPISGVIPGEKVYEIPDYTDITLTKKTRLIRWTTHREDAGVRRYPDGKYDLLIKAWDASGTEVDLNPNNPQNNRLTVVIDNKRPIALLKRIGAHDILRTDEMHPYTPVCPVFSKGLRNLDVRFDAIDENNHFRTYRLRFITGHNITVTDTAAAPPIPPGGFPDEVFTWDISGPDVVPCAYQARLGVGDRTINGYGYIHYAEDTMHFSIEE